MLQIVTLFLALAAPQDNLVIKGELKEVPAQGKNSPSFLCEGTVDLPNGANLSAHLYYGTIIVGKELFKDSAIVKGGKFTQEFPIFDQRTFPGTYTVRLSYDPELQGLGVPDHPRTKVDVVLKVGGAADVDRESITVRNQLTGEIRGLLAIADQVKVKLEEMKEKPQAEREVLFKTWYEQILEMRKRVDPRKHPEYYILQLDLVADSSTEDLAGILTSSARCFVLNQRENTLEGLTRLRQDCEYWIGEISTPRLSDPGKIVAHIEECRAIARKLVDSPDEQVPPARRRFLEITALLDKSVPAEYHDLILGITTRAAAFFNAVSDKSPDMKRQQADLDGSLQRFASTLRNQK